MAVSSRIGEAPIERPRTRGAASVLFRLATGLLLLMLATVASAVFLMALDLVPVSTVTGLFAPVGEWLGGMAEAGVLDRALVAGAAAAVGVAALALLTRTPRAQGRNGSRHVLHADEKGFVLIDSESVQTVAEQAALLNAGVLETQVKVRGRPSGPIRLRIRIDVLPGADVKRIGARVQQSVRDTVENMVGLAVRDANVEVRVMDLDDVSGVLR